MPPLNTCSRTVIAVAIGQMCVAPLAQAATFFPTTTAELIANVITANENGANDIINLGGNSFSLTEVNNTSALGANGLPVIQPDSGSNLTIVSGTIIRDSASPKFRIMEIALGSSLNLQNSTISGGDSPNFEKGGGIFNNGKLSLIGSTISDNAAVSGGGLYLRFSTS